jgi:hypothetical protein
MVHVALCRLREKSCLRSDGQTVEFFLCGLYRREMRGERGEGGGGDEREEARA